MNRSTDRSPFAIALVSFASLLLELGLTRLFSVVLFYHFAFLAISVALLGLGAGGVFAHIRKQWLEGWSVDELCSRASLINAASILVVLQVVLRLPISLDLNWANFGKLTVVYLASAAPFFFTGVMFSVIFARTKSNRISLIYGADLAGGAVACVAVVPLLNWVGGPNVIVFSALAMALSVLLWADEKRLRMAGAAASVLLAVLIAANYRGTLIDIVYAKGMRRDQPWVEFAKWNALSRVEVDQVGGARVIVIDADAATAIMKVDPAKWDVPMERINIDVAQTGRLTAEDGYNWKKDLMSAAPAIANVLRPQGKFAIIGPGGGVDVLRALGNGSKDVTAIEINPIIADDIMRRRYRDYSFNLYGRPEVRLHVGDGRSFIRNSKEQYDVIQMTLVDTWASTAAGAFALSENNLYTVEAFEEYFQHLKPDGFVAITRWEFKEPREALRVMVQATEALKRLGISATGAHFLVVSNGDLTVDGRPVAVLAKKSAFTAAEERAFLAHIIRTETLHVVATPGVWPVNDAELASAGDLRMGPVVPRPFGAQMSRLKVGGVELVNPFLEYARGTPLLQLSQPVPPEDFRRYVIRHYPYDITPVYDNDPFFFFTLKTKDVIRKIMTGTGRGMDWRINLGVTVLFMVFAISVVAVIAFMIMPLALSRQSSAISLQKKHLLYFTAVGLGFILVEIAFIQRFVLFLGHPTYALTVVVFLMLLASGAGAFLSRRWVSDTRRVWIPLFVIVSGVVLYRFLLPAIISTQVGLPISAKLAISAALLIPLGLIMGMPFPTGLRALSERNAGGIEWAWALNGAATVLGSVSAMIIAIHFGLNVTLLCGAGAYLLAAFARIR